MEQHYFIGIKVPSELEPYVEEIRSKYRLRDVYKVIPHVDDLHITLLYIGPLEDKKRQELEQALQIAVKNHLPFSLLVDGTASFGQSEGPRVIYLSVVDHAGLQKLQKEIVQASANILDQPPFERFVPHITIAKKRKDYSNITFEEEKRDPFEFQVNEFSLFAIHPKVTPKYEAVYTVSLK